MARRRRFQFPPKKRILLAGEGDTDRALLRWVTRPFDDRFAFQIFDGGGGSSLHVVQTIERRLRNDRGGRRGAPDHLRRVVFLDWDIWDDNDPNCQEARRLAGTIGLDLRFFRPKVEGVLLRLHPGLETRDPPAHAVEAELRRIWPDYRKGLAADDIAKRFTPDRIEALTDLDRGFRDFFRWLRSQ